MEVNALEILINKLDAFLIPKLVELANIKHEYVLTRQLLRSSTSIGANSREARAAQTRKDFVSKLCIARKECAESQYWVEKLLLIGLLNSEEAALTDNLLTQIFKILNKSISTARKAKSGSK